MKNIMRAISLGLVYAIATSNVAQAGLWQKTKDAACKINPSALAVASAGLLGASVGYGLGYAYVNDALDSTRRDLLPIIKESGAYAQFEEVTIISSGGIDEFAFRPAKDMPGPVYGWPDWVYMSAKDQFESFPKYIKESGKYGYAALAGLWAAMSVADAFKENVKSPLDDGIVWRAAALSVAGLGLSYLIKKERDKRAQQ